MGVQHWKVLGKKLSIDRKYSNMFHNIYLWYIMESDCKAQSIQIDIIYAYYVVIDKPYVPFWPVGINSSLREQQQM